ncbi:MULTISPECIES: acyl-CoA dehydrogenase family protein [Streptomyces]|uniref:acyl-CoA dehydrogenase family protein n=1 Tax=Streptomyces TaxID=1883 RepID=UPI0004C0CC94|nr:MULTISPECIES: acyl-CoA dehydrogenase family protein [Streptomyces]MDX3276983.1 acyl-CoA/acyl-ACP dehydrogenase [Streptomyces scabiei]MDX3847026.1 acyl-CoA/acyl-ACP dehydrogenase [Streptomyces europaeiscabiei]
MSTAYTYLTDDHLRLRDQAQEFGHSVIAPYVPHMEAAGTHTDRELPRLMGELGWCGVILDAEEYGGMGMDHLSKTILITETAYFSGAAGAILQASLIPTVAILYLGSEEQKRLWLPQIAAGLWATIAVTEPECGSHVLGMDGTARRKGGTWVINARKCFIGNSGIAGLHVVVVRTGRPGHPRSLSAFLVEADRDGIEVSQPDLVGMHGFSCGNVYLRNVHVPATHLLGEVGDGLAAAYTASVVCGRPNLAATALGLHRRVMDETLGFLDRRRRKIGKRHRETRKLSEYPVVKYRLAEMKSRLMTAERLAYEAVHLLDKGRACDAELVQSKLVNNQAAGESLRDASSLHGGYAARTDHPITRLMRDIQLVGAPAGPDDVQRYRLSEKALGVDRTEWSEEFIRRTRRSATAA